MFKRRTKTVPGKNKKVRNATPLIVDGIQFRSKLEAYTHKKLIEAGITAKYESTKFTLIDSFRYMGEAVRAMTYTPDFVGDDFIIECKGFGNDAFPLRWKMFKYFLYMNKIDLHLYLPRNQRQVDEVIEKLKARKEDERKKLLQEEGVGI